MGERKGQNKYYPPDFDYRKHKSLDNYHGTHPLRERAKKIHQGIIVIRFEMPYNIWCEGCNNHIGMGVRYNAEKSKIGNYYTTPIYKFRMKCHLCDNYMEIKTDPASHDYVIISGARRKEQRWDPTENGQILTEDKATQKKLATDAMFLLEHGVEDKAKNKQATPGIAQIVQLQTDKKDDYILNKLARKRFREEKKSLKEISDRDGDLLQKSSLDIDLVEEDQNDVKVAKLLHYNVTESFDEKQANLRKSIEDRPLFGSPSVIKSTYSKDNKLEALKKKVALSKPKSNPFAKNSCKTSATNTANALGIKVQRPKQTGEKSEDPSENNETKVSPTDDTIDKSLDPQEPGSNGKVTSLVSYNSSGSDSD